MVPYLFPLNCTSPLSTEEPGNAVFLYRTGLILSEGETSAQHYSPINLSSWYIRIIIQKPNSAPVVAWVGVVTEQRMNSLRTDYASGDLEITAYELSYFFDRVIINRAWVYREITPSIGATTTKGVTKVNVCPSFNENKNHGSGIQGNRTKLQYDFYDDAPKSFAFKMQSKDEWTALDILRYLLIEFSPKEFKINITGQYEALKHIVEVFDFDGLTLWQAIGRLISRKRGLNYHLSISPNDEVNLVVRTETEFNISVGTTNLPANNNQTNFTIPNTYVFNHLVESIGFNSSSANQYSSIVVQGAPIKVCCSFSIAFNTLIKNWKTELQTKYLDADGSTDTDDDQLNDIARSDAKFDNVFTNFIVPSDWDWQSRGTVSTTKYNACPIPKDNGEVEFETYTVPTDPEDDIRQFWYGDKSFLRYLPMFKNVDYGDPAAIPPPIDENLNYTEDLKPFFVVIYDGTDGDKHTKSNAILQLEKMSHVNTDLRDVNYRPITDGIGFELTPSPRHYFAGTSAFSGKPVTQTQPELNYNNLSCTGFISTDQRQRIKLTGASTPNENELVITLPSAEYWYIMPSTIVGIDGATKTYKFITPTLQKARDDVAKLKGVAAFAAAWYRYNRQSVEITMKQTGLFVPLGSLLTSINAAYATGNVGTVITSRRIDFEKQTTTIKTGYAELDFDSFI